MMGYSSIGSSGGDMLESTGYTEVEIEMDSQDDGLKEKMKRSSLPSVLVMNYHLLGPP